MLRFSSQARALVALALIACGGSDSTGIDPSRSDPGIHILAGSAITDTIEAVLPRALVVRVVGQDGKPVPNAVVRFSPTTRTNGSSTQTTMWVTSLSSALWTSLVVDTTNAIGEAAALVRMGAPTGAGRIVITVPVLGLTDTASYTVQPGVATGIAIAPRDTMVYVGGVLTLRVNAVDRYQNARVDPVSLAISRPIATLQNMNATATTVGRARITATVGTRSDTMGVSIVPRGTLVAASLMEHTGIELALYTLDLDGSNLRKIVRSVVAGTGYFGEMPSVWSTDGRTVYYHDNKFDHTKALWSVDVATGTTRRLTSGSAELPHEAWPTVSRDGRWIYYDGADFGGTTLYRISTTGTGRELAGAANIPQASPSVSPDGLRVVSVSATSVAGAFVVGTGPIEVMELATRRLTSLGVGGSRPAWSPVDNRIAYIGTSNDLRIVDASGTGDRALVNDAGFSSRIAWSPDGKYLVVRKGRTLNLVVVDTGEIIPITTTGLTFILTDPSWRP